MPFDFTYQSPEDIFGRLHKLLSSTTPAASTALATKPEQKSSFLTKFAAKQAQEPVDPLYVQQTGEPPKDEGLVARMIRGFNETPGASTAMILGKLAQAFDPQGEKGVGYKLGALGSEMGRAEAAKKYEAAFRDNPATAKAPIGLSREDIAASEARVLAEQVKLSEEERAQRAEDRADKAEGRADEQMDLMKSRNAFERVQFAYNVSESQRKEANDMYARSIDQKIAAARTELERQQLSLEKYRTLETLELQKQQMEMYKKQPFVQAALNTSSKALEDLSRFATTSLMQGGKVAEQFSADLAAGKYNLLINEANKGAELSNSPKRLGIIPLPEGQFTIDWVEAKRVAVPTSNNPADIAPPDAYKVPKGLSQMSISHYGAQYRNTAQENLATFEAMIRQNYGEKALVQIKDEAIMQKSRR
jgi:hypothetical protein